METKQDDILTTAMIHVCTEFHVYNIYCSWDTKGIIENAHRKRDAKQN